MKRSITPKSTHLLAMVFFLLTGAVFAQQGQTQQAEPNVTIRVEKNENGNMAITEDDVRVEDNTSIQSLLKQYGLDQEFGDLKPGEEVEIIVRRRKGPEVLKEFTFDIDRMPEREMSTPPAPPAPPKIKMDGKPLLGVRYHMLSEWEASAKELPIRHGAKVVSVVPNSGASEAGLLLGDIIYAVDGKGMKSMEDLYEYIATKKPGDQVKIEYLRDGKKEKTSAILGERTAGSFGQQNFGKEFFMDQLRNMRVPGEETQKPFLGVAPGQKYTNGVAISSVTPNSTASEMGLQAGDILLSVNGTPTPDWESLKTAIQHGKVGESMTVEYMRNGKKATTSAVAKGRAQVLDHYDYKGLEERILRDHDGDEEIEIIIDGEGDLDEIMEQLKNRHSGSSEEGEIISETRILISMEELTAQEAQAMTEKTGQQFQGEDLQLRSLNLFPNPNNGQFNIAFDLGSKGDVSVKIFDLNGVLVYSELIKDFEGSYNKPVDLGGFAKGTYFLRITQNDQTYTRKIVTQ